MHKRTSAILLFFLACCLTLSACAPGTPGSARSTSPPPTESSPSGTSPSGTPEEDPPVETMPVETVVYPGPDVTLVDWDGPIQHLFFHPVISYPEVCFSGRSSSEYLEKLKATYPYQTYPNLYSQLSSTWGNLDGLDDWMLTADEYKKILQSLYDKGYILMRIEDIWSEYTNESGQVRMQRNTIQVPEGKIPMVFSFDDVNYYPYMVTQGFTHKLVLKDGEIWAWGIDPHTNEEVFSRDLDAITILDDFIKEHPDFSMNGAKGLIALTGYHGILGYRTQSDRYTTEAAQLHNARRPYEIEAVKPIIARLKETGWTFGSHTWGHISLASSGMSTVQNDTERWLDEVGSLVGPTTILIYPHGARPDGKDQGTPGPIFEYLHGKGFRVFASVGIDSYAQIKTTLPAVICDRLHPDGTTLRRSRDRYLPFYDAKDIMDTVNRPDLGVDW